MIDTMHDDTPEEIVPVVPFYTLALYLEDRRYGGPEEGGWWYDCGERVDLLEIDGRNVAMPEVFATEDEAYDARAAKHDLLKQLNEGRREISSVLSDGEYRFRINDGYPPAYFPEHRPHYE